MCLILSFDDWACYRAGDVFDSFLEANPDDPDMCPCLQLEVLVEIPILLAFLHADVAGFQWCIIPVASSCKVKRPSLEAPRGSKISVKEEAGELRILFPPPSWSSLVGPGTFTVAWVTFTAVWTAGVVSAGAPLMSLFSLLTGMQVIFAMAISSPVTLYTFAYSVRTVCICDGHFTDPYSNCFRLQDMALSIVISGHSVFFANTHFQ